MDFKANIEEISIVCTKIDNNTNTLQQEINNAKKALQDIPSSWRDTGSTVFVQKCEEMLKSLQTLASAYKSITTESKKAINKYESLDSELSKKIQSGYIKKTITTTEPVTTPVTTPKKLKTEVLYENNGHSLIRKDNKIYYSFNGKEQLVADLSKTNNNKKNVETFTINGVKLEYSNGQLKVVENKNKKNVKTTETGEYYIKWFNEATGETQYIKAPSGFENGRIAFDGGASIVTKKLNTKTGQYEYVEVVSSKGAK